MLTNREKNRITRGYSKNKKSLRDAAETMKLWLHNELRVRLSNIELLGVGAEGCTFVINTKKYKGKVFKFTNCPMEQQVADWCIHNKPDYMAKHYYWDYCTHNGIMPTHEAMIVLERLEIPRKTERFYTLFGGLHRLINVNTNLGDCHSDNVGVNSKGQLVAFDLRVWPSYNIHHNTTTLPKVYYR